MKFLQKILIVLMVAVATWNVDGMQFSDPRPGPPGQVVNPGGGIPNDTYVDFDVGVNHIYFLADGGQPPANAVGQLACANVNNIAITNWYIEAFGGAAGLAASVAPGIAATVAIGLPTMGCAVPVAAADIIIVNAGGVAPPNFARDFWQAFRTIASTAAGRELLYRILVDIRRIDTTPGHGNRHCYASGTERIGGMSLTVIPGTNTIFVNKESITFDNAHADQLQRALEQYYRFLTTLVTLPANTPHLIAENVINVPGATTAIDQFTQIQIPVHGVNIYFPIDGHQPTTTEAARWSCANVSSYMETSHVTNWYVKMFGGPDVGAMILTGMHVVPGAIDAGYTPLLPLHADPATQVARPIISFRANMNVPSILHPLVPAVASVTNDFWRVFRKIAANPIGRVLLYRILIEIRRKDANLNIGRNENITGVLPGPSLSCRNNNRSLEVSLRVNNGLEFVYGNSGGINFDPNDADSTSVRINNKEIDTHDTVDTLDNGLFHELLHWFHFLKNYARFYAEDVEARVPSEYGYVSRCYYGDVSELFTWGGVDDEEMRTILGTPNHNNLDEVDLFDPNALLAHSDILVKRSRFLRCRDRYLPNNSRYYNGDDLSENAYRMSTQNPLYLGGVIPPGVVLLVGAGWLKMRFGHGDAINPTTIANRFKLAHLVATKCCNGILSQGGAVINNWRLIHGEAAD